MPIGKLAKIANILLALTPLNARLCVISWMARNRLWLAVPPMTYAHNINHGNIGRVCRKQTAIEIWSRKTARTIHLVNMSFVTCQGVIGVSITTTAKVVDSTSGCAFRMANRLEWRGSSVINHKKSDGSCSGSGYPLPSSWTVEPYSEDLSCSRTTTRHRQSS